MNMESNKDPCHDPLALFSEVASPYLSPFQGLNSDENSNSLDQQIPRVHLDPPSNMNDLGSIGFESQHHKIEDPSVSQGFEHDGDEPEPPINGDQVKVRTVKMADSHGGDDIKAIITFLVQNDRVSERDLLRLGKPYFQQSRDKQFIFQVLMPKFLKLRKTKEEMTKYCMRKAFKFIGELKTVARKKGSKISKKQESEGFYLNLEMPFKKNSQDKTMNSHFLRRTFSQKEFVDGYKEFLASFEKLMDEDNESKIDFLAQMIEKLQQNNELDKIQSIKRLPWTNSILSKTEELAKRLLEYSEGGEAHDGP